MAPLNKAILRKMFCQNKRFEAITQKQDGNTRTSYGNRQEMPSESQTL